MSTFDKIITDLHDNSALTDESYSSGYSTPSSEYITITPNRTFQFSEGFNKTIAYVGDVNSQIITFELPEKHEGHSLWDCENKKVCWINPANGVEGKSDLIHLEGNKYKWVVPPALFTKECNIEFSIVVYDLSSTHVAFSWNTSVCSELMVKKTNEKVGIESLPARDEILIVDAHTKKVTAPNGYNNTIAIAGDVGVSTVYFQIERNVKGIDILGSSAEIKVNYSGKGTKSYSSKDTDTSIRVIPYSVEYENQGTELALVIWDLPREVTEDEGKFSISLTFSDSKRVWSSYGYGSLNVGQGLITS